MSDDFPTFAPIFGKGTKYLTFLHFDSDDLQEAIALVRDACARSKKLQDEVIALLSENGWREHLLAAVAILTVRNPSKEIAHELWQTFDRGSWVSPQLAVVAWLRDLDFEVRARERISSGNFQDTTKIDCLDPLERHVIAGPSTNAERSAKGLSALVYLIGKSVNAGGWLANEMRRSEIKSRLAHDVDFGGKIAETWLGRVRLNSSALGLEGK
ncbi:MAG TPA: hypothetical protein VFZ59_21465 [Verrucomicrobiae bacterium]|nr:hypothetical protein [Verrucomicrobiae bacterium]